MSQFATEYQTFFESAAGQQFLTFIHKQIDTEHEAAEDEPSASAAYGHSKTAKAYRGVLTHIQSVTAGKEITI